MNMPRASLATTLSAWLREEHLFDAKVAHSVMEWGFTSSKMVVHSHQVCTHGDGE